MRPAGWLIAALVAAPLSAQNTDAALVRRVDSVFAAWSRTTTPGCAVGVDQGGMPIIRRAYGMANLETGTPFTLNTLSESGSVAKQFTASAIVLLAMDGKLSLEDDITRWLPEAKGFGRKITIRHLLTHTSGIPDRYLLHQAQGRPAGEVDHPNGEVVAMVSHLKDLNFDPGEDYLYSNTNYILAATIVERVSKQTLQQFTDARIFKPLGMTSTRWREDHRTVVPNRASAYAGTEGRGFTNDHPFTRVIGSGGLLVTVDDFLKWQAALQNGTGPFGTVRDSLEKVMRLNDGTEDGYGLGVGVDTWRGVRRVSHTGATGGYRAALVRFPAQNVAIALLCNGGATNPGDMANRVAVAVLGSTLAAVEPDPAPVSVDAASLAPFVGAYVSPRTSELTVLMVRNGALVDSTSSPNPLIALGSDKFRYRGSGGMLELLSGTPARIRYSTRNARPVEYVKVGPARADSASLAAYAGKYRSPELDAIFTVVVRGDSLLLDNGWKPADRFRPLYQDGFDIGGAGIAQFSRDAKGRVTGFSIWAGRVRHLRFDRIPSK